MRSKKVHLGNLGLTGCTFEFEAACVLVTFDTRPWLGLTVFDELNQLGIWDFRIDSFATSPEVGDDVLTILGSTDFSYYHQVEVQFFETDFVYCPIRFCHARFEEADRDKLTQISFPPELNPEARLFSIIAEDSVYFIAAQNAAVRIETVKYSERNTSESQE